MDYIYSFNNLPLEINQLILNKLDFLSQIRFRQVFKKLKIYDFCDIDNKYLELLNDKILKAHLFIQKLNATNNLKITNKGINHLDLIKLDTSNNRKITNI